VSALSPFISEKLIRVSRLPLAGDVEMDQANDILLGGGSGIDQVGASRERVGWKRSKHKMVSILRMV
jgi:hypothetical protein